MSEKPVPLRLDPASIQAIARVVLVAGFIGAWCTLIHILTGRTVTPARMLVLAALLSAGYAVASRERPLALSLNRWDEAIAFLGLAVLAQMAVVAVPP